MKFLCVGFFDADRMTSHSREVVEAAMVECGHLLQALYQTGRVLVDIGVDAAGMNLSAVAGGGTTSSLLHEAGHMIGGVFLLEAENLEEATGIAALHPAISSPMATVFGWSLQVRPVHTFSLPSDSLNGF